MTKTRVGFILCVCTGDCPGFATMNVWDLINQVRLALPVEWAIVHPQLCEIDGDRFLDDILKSNSMDPNMHYFIAGCSPNMQLKLMSPAFKKRNLEFSEMAKPLDVRNMTTDEAFDAIEKQLEDWGIIDE